MTSLLEQLIASPRLVEVDRVDVAATPERVWQIVRHGDLARSPLVRALFALRATPERLAGRSKTTSLRIDHLKSTPENPGFSLLLENEHRELAVGAIGKVWQPVIVFQHAPDAVAFQGFEEPDWVKVAWAIRLLPLGDSDCRVEVEVRVVATDERAWQKFARYFRVIGPGSHLIRRALLRGLASELGTPESAEDSRPLPGDELLPAVRGQVTEAVTLRATPEEVWPWLLQMGCQRAGYYSVDFLDNAGRRSSREVVPELQQLSVGDIVPTTPDGGEGFEVLGVDAPRSLVFGTCYDTDAQRQVPFHGACPRHYWRSTWAFVLERLNESSTRLHVRAKVAGPTFGRLHAVWIRPVHRFMQREMLAHLAARVERRLPRDDHRDVLEGMEGAALILAGFLTPFLRHSRSHWGVEPAAARASRPGDELVPVPLWSWTHGIEVMATPELVWHWVAQVGADRAGFYSYQWLENLVGCGLRNADAIHQDWELELGDSLVLHPDAPPLKITELQPGKYFVAHGAPDEQAVHAGRPWANASWLFQIEPLPGGNCRLVTRYRVAYSSDFTTWLAMGPVFLEPISFTMDRRMLLGIKHRAEQQAHYALTTSRSRTATSSGTTPRSIE